MGCDIHMFCEYKKTVNNKEIWVNADNWRINPYYDGDDKDESKHNVSSLLSGRNYSLFSALCGVRDYSDSTPKISEPRGMPEGVSPEIIQENKEWGGDGHSHSYATLAEVFAFNKLKNPVKFSGLISVEQANKLDDNGVTPDSWCQGSSDKTMVHRVWEDDSLTPLSVLFEKMTERFNDVGWFFGRDIPTDKMDDFRIVFWFDN